MDPRSFLTLATLLATTTRGPAEYRTSISRSYYAAFHVAVAFLRDHAGLEPLGGRDKHASVKACWLQCGDAVGKQIGIALDTLHTQRKHADYDMRDSRSEGQNSALAISTQATKLVEVIDRIAGGEPNLAPILTGMRTWALTPHANVRSL